MGNEKGSEIYLIPNSQHYNRVTLSVRSLCNTALRKDYMSKSWCSEKTYDHTAGKKEDRDLELCADDHKASARPWVPKRWAGFL